MCCEKEGFKLLNKGTGTKGYETVSETATNKCAFTMKRNGIVQEGSSVLDSVTLNLNWVDLKCNGI